MAIRHTPKTIAELIVDLQKLPQDAILVMKDHDLDYDSIFVMQITGVGDAFVRGDEWFAELHSGFAEGDWYEEIKY
jgi:hypothetical protein